MNRCKYCNGIIWPWQSYYYRPSQQQTRDYAILIRPDYDTHSHAGCFFLAHNQEEVQQEKEKEINPITPLLRNPLTPLF